MQITWLLCCSVYTQQTLSLVFKPNLRLFKEIRYTMYVCDRKTREKCFCKTSFQLGMGLKKVQKQAEMKEHKDYPASAKNTQQLSGSLFTFFHLCLVSVLFSCPSLTEMKFYRNYFPTFCSTRHSLYCMCSVVQVWPGHMYHTRTNIAWEAIQVSKWFH